MNALLCMAGTGALGGVVSAMVSGNRFVLPTVVHGPGARIVRHGLAIHLAVGSLAAALLLGPVAMTTAAVSSKGVVPLLPAAIAIGLLSARCLSNEADKRLLRSSVRYAATSPAVHPDSVEEIASAPPSRLFTIAKEMLPAPRAPR